MSELFCSNGKFFKGAVEKEWMKKRSSGEIKLAEHTLILDNSPS